MQIKSRITRTQISVVLLLLLSTLTAQASVKKIDGQTVQIPTTFSIPDKPVTLNKYEIQQLAQKAAMIKPSKAGFQPLTTNAMHVCQNFKSRQSNVKHLISPIFIVGDDPVSLRWMQLYKATLNRIHAVGLVVSANSVGDFEKIKNVAGNIKLYPAIGDAVSQFFGIKCYPVLISKHLIEQ